MIEKIRDWFWKIIIVAWIPIASAWEVWECDTKYMR